MLTAEKGNKMLTIIDMRKVVLSDFAFSVWDSVTDEFLKDTNGEMYWSSFEEFMVAGFSRDVVARVQYLLVRQNDGEGWPVKDISASVLAPDWRVVGPVFDINSDFEDPADGEIVAVWIKNDKGEEGPHLGKVIKTKKMWVDIFRFWSSGEGFLADKGNLLSWAKAEHIPVSDLPKEPKCGPQV
jgi:hypothetical protein